MDPRRTDNSLLAGQRALVTGANTGVGAVIAQALYVARVIRARIEGRTPPGPFAYRHLGSLATIGRKAAVADFEGRSSVQAW
jgi:NADH dehydrogenase FAD-containing subunit